MYEQHGKRVVAHYKVMKVVAELYRKGKDPAEIATITGLLEGQVIKILRQYLPTVNRRKS